MKTTASYLRVIGFVFLSFFLLELIIESGDSWAIAQYPIIWLILCILTLIAVALEISLESLKSILYHTLDDDAKERFLANAEHKKEHNWFQKTYKKLLGAKPIEKEQDIVLDHNYDGIRELDNTLPPWWVYLFYITIVFAVVYMSYYHIFGGIDQEQEYKIEMAKARIEIEEYKKTAKNFIDASNVELLTEKADLTNGKAIFDTYCVACHKSDGGGGIGPNLTDHYWILGGGIKNVFNTISEGGRAGKGMISWKNDLSPHEIAQVSSYILTLVGTTPAEPKEPEGELWKEDEKPPAEETTP